MRVGYFTMPLHPPGADPGRTMAQLGFGIADTTAEARRQALAEPLGRDWTGYFLPLVRKGRDRPGCGLPRAERA